MEQIPENFKMIVPSNFSKDVFIKSVNKKLNIDVLFEGVDTNLFKKISNEECLKSKKIKEINDKLEKDNVNFAFLITGQWVGLNRKVNVSGRKNIKNTITTFYKTFYGIDNVGLVLKTNAGNNSIIDREEVLTVLNDVKNYYAISNHVNVDELPPVYLLHTQLTDEEINMLYNLDKIKAMLAFTKGEGYGRPLAEFAAIGKPVLATG